MFHVRRYYFLTFIWKGRVPACDEQVREVRNGKMWLFVGKMAIRNVDDDDNDDDGVDDKCIFMWVELNNRMNELSCMSIYLK